MTTTDPAARLAGACDQARAVLADLDRLAQLAATSAWVRALDAAAPWLDDPDDPHAVDLAGRCSICSADVDAETGVCRNGHDDVDRAGGTGPDPDEPGTAGLA